jgi:hypothetical protein
MEIERKRLETEHTGEDIDFLEALMISKPPGSVNFSKFEFFDDQGRTRGWEVAFSVRLELIEEHGVLRDRISDIAKP